MIKVSVIIPTYNRAHLITRAVQSVINQDYSPVEILILDDGSTDNTQEVLKPFIESGKVLYYVLPHQGAQAARIFGMKQAKGKYLFFLDSDDEFTEGSIQKRIEVFEKVKCDAMVYGKVISNGRVSNFPVMNGFVYKDLSKTLMLTPYSTIAVTKNAVVRTGFPSPDFPACQDDDFVMTVAKENPVYFLPEIVVEMYPTKNSIWNTGKNRIAGVNMLFEKYRHDILQYHGKTGIFFWKIRLYKEKLYCKWLYYSGKSDMLSVCLRKFYMLRVLICTAFLKLYFPGTCLCN